MDARSISRSDLAARMGISYQAVRDALKTGKFSAANSDLAAEILRVSHRWLARGKGQMDVTAAPEPTVEDAVDVLRGILRSAPLPSREKAAAALTQLARAPDSDIAREDALAVLAGVTNVEVPPTEAIQSMLSEEALSLARAIDSIPSEEARKKALQAAVAAASRAEAIDDAPRAPSPADAPSSASRPASTRKSR